MVARPETLLIAIVALPFVGSCLAVLFRVNARNAEAYLAGLLALLAFILVIATYPHVLDGGVIQYNAAWAPELKLEFNLRMDGFAWMLAALITGIGFLVVLYARYYMSAADPAPRFFSFLLAFMGAMLGIVLSGNLIQLVFFWELTSLFSFLLIGYRHQNAQARDGARMALIVTTAGGLCLFAGVLVIGHIVGSYDLDRVLASGAAIREHSLYVPALVLVLIGALTKSAQFPFHFWLPHAMAAPTPVSAYLHSATMVKAGVFLLARLWPALGGTNEWLWFIGSIGLVTFILGALIAVFQQDLKGLLAYSTISHLGLITLLIGLDTPLGLVAAIFHMMNHATFKASLFMAAGIIDHETGTRDLRRLSGLWRFMPITATLAIVAAAAMAGVPLLNGFLSKEMFFAETIEVHDNSFVDRALPYIVTAASMFTVAYSLRFIREVFFGRRPEALPRTPREPPFLMRLPAELLVLACLVVGVIPALTIGPLLETALSAIFGAAIPEYSLVVWHGVTPELLMSLVAISGGAAMYFTLRSYLLVSDGPPLLRHIRAQRIFDHMLVAVSWRLARRLEILLSTRRLQPQLLLLVCAALVAGAAPFHNMLEIGAEGAAHSPFDLGFAIVWVVGIGCALAAANRTKFHRLAALILLGGAGLVTCVSFVWLSAPDVALTQLVVEAVTTVLLLLGLRWLPKRIQARNPAGAKPSVIRGYRIRDFAVAVAAGWGLAALAYAVMVRPRPETIADFFVENAYTKGGGTNIVNVILVDFRAFDTFGEITVLGIVALTVYALLRRFRPAVESISVPQQQRVRDASHDAHESRLGGTATDSMAIVALMMAMLFPVIGMAAAFLLLRGHDWPGGGFVAGVIMAIAFILQYMARGTLWVEDRLRILPMRWMGTGLLLAFGVGSAAWLFDGSFLSSVFFHVDIPWIGVIPIASALLFDLGVFALVVGGTVLMLIAIAHQSIRSHRTHESSDPAASSDAEVR
jgi:multicomponent K+:H+ antiporter subunit A